MEEEEDIGDQMREEDDQIIDTMEEGVTQMEEGGTIATVQINKETEVMNGKSFEKICIHQRYMNVLLLHTD